MRVARLRLVLGCNSPQGSHARWAFVKDLVHRMAQEPGHEASARQLQEALTVTNFTALHGAEAVQNVAVRSRAACARSSQKPLRADSSHRRHCHPTQGARWIRMCQPRCCSLEARLWVP